MMDFKGFICILVLYISTNNGAALPEPEENYHYHFNQLAVTYAFAGQDTIPQPAHTFVAKAPQNIVETRPIASHAIPAPPAPYAAIPPVPNPGEPVPPDTVVQQKIAASIRTHTRITPQVTNIVPQINVQNYKVDVTVAVPHAVPVPAPFKDHAVQEIVESPHIHHARVETHSNQAVVTTHANPLHAGEDDDNKEAL